MKKYQTISVVLKDFELEPVQVVSEKVLLEYLKGIDGEKVRSFDTWLIGPTYCNTELLMWKLKD
jgi:hypothetical protein